MKISNEIKAALIVFGGIFLFLIGFNFLNGTSLFKRENTHYAIYDNVEGLQIGTKVTVNGLAVGKVSAIDFHPKSTQLLVTFSLRNDVQFSSNSIAELYEAGLIGGKSIAIIPVFDQAPRMKDGDTLKGRVKPGLTDLVNQQIAPLQQKLEQVLVDADSLFTGINEVLSQEGKANISNTLASLSSTVENINKAAVSFDNLLSAQENNLSTTLDNVSLASKNLAKLSDSLAAANVKQTVTTLQKTLAELEKTLTAINQKEGTAGKLIYDTDLYDNLSASTKEVELLLRDLKEHPKRYVHFSLFGKKGTPYKTPQPIEE